MFYDINVPLWEIEPSYRRYTIALISGLSVFSSFLDKIVSCYPLSLHHFTASFNIRLKSRGLKTLEMKNKLYFIKKENYYKKFALNYKENY